MKRLILISTLAVLGLNLELGLFPHRVDANETAANETAASKTATAGTQLSPTAVIEALEKELKRSFSKLEKAGKVPLYFLAYRLYEGNWEHIAAKDGALEQRKPAEAWRMSAVDLRVGSPHFDNSHYLRANRSSAPTTYDNSNDRDSSLPVYGAGLPLRQSFWLKTSDAFKRAQSRYLELKASKDVLAEEDDKSADFSLQPMHQFVEEADRAQIDRPSWEEKVRRLSRLFLRHPKIQTSLVSFDARPTTRYIVTSEGSRIIEQQPRYSLAVKASSLADDGMNLSLWNTYAAREPARLPDQEVLTKEVKSLALTLDKLRVAKAAEPFVGPAILSGRAAAVFFHETFGHRIEAIHEKNESEGKTFSKKIGTQVMPAFLCVTDDPTVKEAHGEQLGGYYVYDDEGVPGQPVKLAENGNLTGFLLGRMLVSGFSASNGHGRCSPGWNPMARQSNLFIKADKDKQVAPEALRQLLIKEAKKQKKSYGLFFDEVSGGFTWTARGSEQTYSILPLLVYKVFVDGRPDELIRGVDIVGTPLSALEHIIAAGTDYAVFNGVCGRESGSVPVSAVAPSLLIESIEIKRTTKTFEKPPILPDPTVETGKIKDINKLDQSERKENGTRQ